MTHLGHDFPQRALQLITNVVSLFPLIVVVFVLQYILDMVFACSCKPGLHPNGFLYLLLPPVILTWVVNITEPFHHTRIFSICRNRRICCCSPFKLFINYFSMALVWAASVLFDGDWYLCLMTNLNPKQTGIPCKVNNTYKESQIIADYKTTSLDIGLGLICFLVFSWSIAECIITFDVRKGTWKNVSVSKWQLWHPPYYRVVYEDLLAEQVNSHLKNELTKIASERAQETCRKYLRAIGDHERSFKDTGDGANNVDNKVLEAWQKISDSDFPFK